MFKINPESDDRKIFEAKRTKISKNFTLQLTNQKYQYRQP